MCLVLLDFVLLLVFINTLLVFLSVCVCVKEAEKEVFGLGLYIGDNFGSYFSINVILELSALWALTDRCNWQFAHLLQDQARLSVLPI